MKRVVVLCGAIGIVCAGLMANHFITQAETATMRLTGAQIEAAHAKELAQTTSPETIQEGQTVTATKTAPCGRSVAALDEAVKWAALKDQREMVRTIVTTGSGILKAGDPVKILDITGFLDQKARVRITRSGTEFECWVPMEALR